MASTDPESAKAAKAGGSKSQNLLSMPRIVLSVENPLGKTVSIDATETDCVMDIRQFLLETPESCYFTCYSLYHEGKQINDFAELSEYPEITVGKTNALKMAPGFYDERSAKQHVRRFREIIVNPPVHITQNSNPYVSEADAASAKDKLSAKRGSRAQAAGLAQPFENPNEPDILKKFVLTQLSKPETKISGGTVPEMVKNINFSAWNPPPGNRRLRGDLLYIEVSTLENNTLHITCSVSGFFLNRSTRERFDPFPAETDYNSHTLVELLKKASHGFSSKFSKLMNRRMTKHPFEVIQRPFEIYDWMVKPKPHAYDWNRAEDTLLTTYGMEGGRGVLRDWNEEYQCCREMPSGTLLERVLRNRTKYRVYLDFRDAAVKGAMAVVNGNIPPVNPMDEERAWVYLYNKIFFSLTIDGRGSFKEIGGDAVCHCNANHDLLGIAAVEKVDAKELHTLATIVIDYRGHRVLAQSVIPGIFHGDHMSSHVYGSMDSNSPVKSDPEFHKKMLTVGNRLHLKEHEVSDTLSKSNVKLVSGLETKGIIGSDRRKYLLDLTRLFPRDANYPDYKQNPTALLRPELVSMYVSQVSLQKMIEKRKKEAKEQKEAKESKASAKPAENSSKNSPESTAATKDTNSKATEEKKKVENEKKGKSIFDGIEEVRFNPNVYTDVVHPNEDEEKKDKLQVAAASQFLMRNVIPRLVAKSFRYLQDSPLDGRALTDLMHKNGINVRYLGQITALASRLGMPHIAQLCTQEMLCRAAKHTLNAMLRDVKPDLSEAKNSWFLAPVVTRFLNTFLGQHCGGRGLSDEELDAALKVLEAQDKQEGEKKKQVPRAKTRAKRRRKKTEKSIIVKMADGKKAPTDPLAPANLWMSLHRTVLKKFRCKLPKRLDLRGRQRLCMLRSLCKKVGIQLACRNYVFQETKGQEDFLTVDDIVDLYPVVKTVEHRSRDARDFTDQGRVFLSHGRLSAAYKTFSDAQGIIHQTYGPMHSQAAEIYSLIALVCYRAQDIPQAVEMQQKALLVYERLLGTDHYETAHAHSTMALYLHSMGKSSHALTHIKRALFLYELMCGPLHPDVAAAHINIAMIYQDNAQVKKGLAHLRRAKECFSSVLGKTHSQIGLCEHTIAVAHSLMGNFREAINFEKKSKAIYLNSFGDKHPRVKESIKWLNWFTENAVNLEISALKSKSNGSKAAQKPLAISHPSLSPFVWVSLQKQVPIRAMQAKDLVQLIKMSKMRADQLAKKKNVGEAKMAADIKKTAEAQKTNTGEAALVSTELSKAQKKRLKRKKKKQAAAQAREEAMKAPGS